MEPRRKELEEEQQESDRMDSLIRQIISGIYLFIFSLLLFFRIHKYLIFIYIYTFYLQSKSPANDRIIVANHFQSTCIRVILLRSQYTHVYYLLIQQP